MSYLNLALSGRQQRASRTNMYRQFEVVRRTGSLLSGGEHQFDTDLGTEFSYAYSRPRK